MIHRQLVCKSMHLGGIERIEMGLAVHSIAYAVGRGGKDFTNHILS